MTLTFLVLCDDDVDVYRIEIGPNEGVSARISHEPGAGDIMLTLRSLDEEAVGVSEAGVARAGLLARGGFFYAKLRHATLNGPSHSAHGLNLVGNT